MATKTISIGVGMPANIKLNLFGHVIWDAFGTPAYLVGSALMGKKWRDVDVRLILDDDEYAKVVGSLDPINAKLNALNLAFAVLGKEMTGLRIDFQIQQQTDANKRFAKQPRSALGITQCRISD